MSVAAASRASSRSSKLTTPAEDTMLMVTPSTLEVDYDTESTELYKAITQQEWNTAISVCEADPVQASVWVVRHSQSDATVLWRFLPLHSACARQPPAELVRALLKAYPDAAACVDDQGMYALHYAAGNQASLSVLRALIDQCPAAVHIRDPRGMIALHYAACWGPGDCLACIDLLLTPKTATARDNDGNTAQDLAEQASYPLRNAVIRTLQAATDGLLKAATGKRSIRRVPSVTSTSQDSSHESRYDIEGRRFQQILDQREQQQRPSSLSSSRASRSRGKTVRIGSSENTTESVSSSTRPVLSGKSDDDDKSKDATTTAAMMGVREQQQVNSTTEELEKLRAELEQARDEIAVKDEEIRVLLTERDAARLEAEQSQGLREDLESVTNQHESTKRRFKETQDRLASISVSLESVLMQNEVVRETMETVKDMDRARKDVLDRLASLDFHVDEARINSSLEKQQREMEAISAIIKAARD